MGKRGRTRAAGDTRTHQRRIMLCLFPGLYSYSPEAGTERELRPEVRNAVMTYDIFSVDKEMSSMQNLTVVAQAVVILSK